MSLYNIQPYTSGASKNKGYPVEAPGMLEVLGSPDGWTVQRYTTFSSSSVYFRARTASGSWTGWTDMSTSGGGGDTGGGTEIVSYSITRNLTNVTSSNAAGTIQSGSTYSTKLTPTTGYALDSVRVTMGGVDITASAYSNGSISIDSVSGSIVITASASVATVKCTVKSTLTNVTSSNTATSVAEGSAYQAYITVPSGYTIQGVKIGMGNTDITASAWTASENRIYIASVTGNVTITVYASASASGYRIKLVSPSEISGYAALEVTGDVEYSNGYLALDNGSVVIKVKQTGNFGRVRIKGLSITMGGTALNLESSSFTVRASEGSTAGYCGDWTAPTITATGDIVVTVEAEAISSNVSFNAPYVYVPRILDSSNSGEAIRLSSVPGYKITGVRQTINGQAVDITGSYSISSSGDVYYLMIFSMRLAGTVVYTITTEPI